jgi:hypothetical protein
MKTTTSFLSLILLANLAAAAEQSPQEALLGASKNLAEKSNYSWKLTVEEPDRPTGTIDGRIQNGGAAFLTLARGDQAFEAALKGTKAVLKTDDGWKSAAEIADDSSQSGAARIVARLLQNFKAPAVEAADLAAKIKDLKKVQESYTGTLDKETATDLFFFRVRPDTNGPEVKGAKGSIKFWVKDSLISKYEYTVEAVFTINGNEREAKRTCTLEIKDVGTTKVNIPDEAAKQLKT